MIQDYKIHRFIREKGGKVRKKEILEAFGSNKESKRLIEEKLTMMARFGLITINRDEVTIK